VGRLRLLPHRRHRDGIAKCRASRSGRAMTGDFPTSADCGIASATACQRRARPTPFRARRSCRPSWSGADKASTPTQQQYEAWENDADAGWTAAPRRRHRRRKQQPTSEKLFFDYRPATKPEAVSTRTEPPSSPPAAARLQQRRPRPWIARPNTILVDSRAARIRKRACRPTSRSWPTRRSRSSRPRPPGFPGATPTPSPTRNLMREVLKHGGQGRQFGETSSASSPCPCSTRAGRQHRHPHPGVRAFGTQLRESR